MGENDNLDRDHAALTRRVEELEAELQAARDELVGLKSRNAPQSASVTSFGMEQRDLFQTLIEHVPIHIYAKDLNSKFIYSNTPEVHPPGSDDFDRFPAETAQVFLEEERKIMETRVPLISERQSITMPEDGNTRWVRVTKLPLVNEKDEVIGLLGHNQNITDLTQSAEALRVERRLLKAMLDNIPDRIYFKDSQSRFTHVSRALMDNLNVTHEEDILGLSDFDFFTQDHAQKAFSDEQNIIKTGEPMIEMEEEETLPDGRGYWLSTTKLPLEDEAGSIIGTFGLSRNISRLKELEIQHLQIIEDLKQALSQVKQLSGLVPICSYCKKIRDDKGFWNNLEEYINEHSEAQLSHGICDACMSVHFPDYDPDKDKKA